MPFDLIRKIVSYRIDEVKRQLNILPGGVVHNMPKDLLKAMENKKMDLLDNINKIG